MASSTYNAFVLLSSQYYDELLVVHPGGNIVPYLESQPVIGYVGSSLEEEIKTLSSQVYRQLPSEFPGIIISCRNKHTCREAVISNISRVVEQSFPSNFMGRPVVFIEYYSENGKTMAMDDNKERVEIMKKFAEKVFSNRYSSLRMSFDGGKVWISYKPSGNRQHFDSSLLMYCLRHYHILDAFLKECGNFPQSWDKFLHWFSHAILRNADWGDGSNVPLALSFYAYCSANSHVQWSYYSPQSVSGPNNLIQMMPSVRGLIKFMKFVVLPAYYPEEIKLDEAVNINLGGSFKESFKELYRYIKREFFAEARRNEAKQKAADKALEELMRVDSRVEVPPTTKQDSVILEPSNPEQEGTEGQDHESYTDNQDRESYRVDSALEDEEYQEGG